MKKRLIFSLHQNIIFIDFFLIAVKTPAFILMNINKTANA